MKIHKVILWSISTFISCQGKELPICCGWIIPEPAWWRARQWFSKPTYRCIWETYSISRSGPWLHPSESGISPKPSEEAYERMNSLGSFIKYACAPYRSGKTMRQGLAAFAAAVKVLFHSEKWVRLNRAASLDCPGRRKRKGCTCWKSLFQLII